VKKITATEKGHLKIAIVQLQIAIAAATRDESLSGVSEVIKTLRRVVPQAEKQG